jgi:RimJ/RimL family protein N-acetyltransferase
MSDFETARLVFHRPKGEDFAESAAMWADPAITRHIGGTPSTAEESWTRLLRNVGHWHMFGYGFWVVRERDSGRFVGEIGIKQARRDGIGVDGETPETGWVLACWAHGRGYATEAASAALAWADAKFVWPRTICIIDPENTASRHVAAKLGYAEVSRPLYRDKVVILLQREAPTPPPAG